MENLFDTIEKQNTGVSNFKMLIEHPGWKLMEKIIDANIQDTKDAIIYGVKDETEDTINRLRDKLVVLEGVKSTPYDHIAKYEDKEEDEEIRSDPFDTVEDVEKAKKEKS